MKLGTKILSGLVLLFLLAQFIPSEKNRAIGVQPNDIFTKYPAPVEVQAIAKKACYDCHSNNTVYPWYSNVQPLAWWINDHVKEGKEEFNYSEFTTYSPKRARHKLEEVGEQINEHEMPLNSYTWIHAEARLTDAERKVLTDWAMATRESIPAPPKTK